MTKNYPHEFQHLGVVVLAAGQETGSAAAASIARASGQPSYASLREPCAPAYASLRARTPLVSLSAVSEAFVCPSKGCKST